MSLLHKKDDITKLLKIFLRLLLTFGATYITINLGATKREVILSSGKQKNGAPYRQSKDLYVKSENG